MDMTPHNAPSRPPHRDPGITYSTPYRSLMILTPMPPHDNYPFTVYTFFFIFGIPMWHAAVVSKSSLFLNLNGDRRNVL